MNLFITYFQIFFLMQQHEDIEQIRSPKNSFKNYIYRIGIQMS